jgi:hypothetical protein
MKHVATTSLQLDACSRRNADFVRVMWREAPPSAAFRLTWLALSRSMVMPALMLLLTAACTRVPPRTTTESTKPVEPTADVQATVQAAVSATVQAVPKAAEPKPAAQQPTTAPAAPTQPLPADQVVPKPPPAQPAPAKVAADKPAVSPAISPQAVAGPRVEVPEFNSYKNSIGATIVQGIVENKGQVTAANITIAVSLLGENGATVGATQAFTKPGILKAGAKAPWQAHAGTAPEFKEIRIQVQADPLSPIWESRYTQDFRLEGVTAQAGTPPLGWPKIVGQVTNSGGQLATSVRVIAAVYQADGKLLEVGSTTAKLQEIAPGQSSPFELTFIGGRGIKEIPRHELFVEGNPRS